MDNWEIVMKTVLEKVEQALKLYAETNIHIIKQLERLTSDVGEIKKVITDIRENGIYVYQQE